MCSYSGYLSWQFRGYEFAKKVFFCKEEVDIENSLNTIIRIHTELVANAKEHKTREDLCGCYDYLEMSFLKEVWISEPDAASVYSDVEIEDITMAVMENLSKLDCIGERE
jgi:hypothetical protein